jgi:hypothetical protein
MLGFVSSVAFYKVSSSTITGLNWRLMLGSTAIPYVPPIHFLHLTPLTLHQPNVCLHPSLHVSRKSPLVHDKKQIRFRLQLPCTSP